MNIELIKKYKTEFNHWLNCGDLLIRNNDDRIWMNMSEVHWDMNYKNVSIIINDNFSELRKALCDGKIIQLYVTSEQHISDPSQDIYKWTDFKSLTPSSSFSGLLKNYRIKPEESDFKEGDFVRVSSPSGEYFIERISSVNNDNTVTLSEKYVAYISDCILWKPTYGELCWVRNSKWSNKEESIFKAYDYDACRHYDLCEPFLNSKPSWFKD